jgi:hypothetical protein
VSVANICPYCVEMHSVSLYDLSTEQDAEAVAADRAGEMADPRLREVSLWARTAHELDSRVPLPAEPDSAAAAELIGVVVGLHYLGRMVNVFLSNFLLPPGLGPRARRRFKHGVSRVMRPTLRTYREPGRSLDLLPDAPLPAGAGWAAASPSVAGAVARAYRTFDEAGVRSLSPAVRAMVLGRLDRWRGEETGLSTQWCEEMILDLPGPDRSAGRLALLTALASYQVDEDVIELYRRDHPGDPALLDATAWASFAAARTIGARLGAAPAGANTARQETRRDGSPYHHGS